MSMRKKRAFTLIELLVVVAIIALLISILLPSLSRARELSKRLVCSANLKGIGTACKIYAQDNEDRWPNVPFDESQGYGEVQYTNQIYERSGQAPGVDRYEITHTKQDELDGEGTASTEVSTTRCYWMLVRSGAATTKQFLCPSSDDLQDDTNEIARYYDFQGIRYVSYGYQVPFGPPSTRPSDNVDMRMVLAADKGPFSAALPTNNENYDNPSSGDFADFNGDSAPTDWAPLNSPNHGGFGNGEGQNCLYADGHADFMKVPVVGIDEDNIYSVMDGPDDEERWLGGCPYEGGANGQAGKVYPGEKAFRSGQVDAVTDCLIYP